MSHNVLQTVMPPHCWPTEPTEAIAAFEKAHSNSEGGALLFWALRSADALHYLGDIDDADDASRCTAGNHLPDLVDVAHARWATGTCMTALDLAAAGLARALGGHHGHREFVLGDFAKPQKAARSVIAGLPPAAMLWISQVLADTSFTLIKDARDALTHRRLVRHQCMSAGSSAPNPRLELSVGPQRVPVSRLVRSARDLATSHLSQLLSVLPRL